ncbi:MAG: hypothetical protein KAH48_06565 [Chlorobi bacterium]|nr:hypothetical protein [Chlorobiota bacterium]
MDYSSLLHDFVDGSLGKAQEKELFEALASDGGLRSEMKEFLEFEKLAQFDGAAFTPSAAVTDSLFATLGIAGAGGTAVAAATMAAKTGFWQSIVTHSSSIISTILAATVGAVAMFFFMPRGSGNSENINLTDKVIIAASEVAVDRDEYLNLKQSTTEIEKLRIELAELSSRKNQVIIKFRDRIIEREVPVYIERKSKNYAVLSLSPLIITERVPAFHNARDYSQRPSSDVFVNNSRPQTDLLIDQAEDYDLTNKQLGLSIEFQGGQYLSVQEAGISQSEQPLFNNSGVSIAYEVLNDLSLVFDFRQEFFYQVYSGYENDGIKYKYEQYPNFSSLGLGVRYKIVDWEYLDLNSQLMLSLAPGNGSWIYRAFVGGEFKASRNIGVLIGAELNGMQYHHIDYFGSKTNDLTATMGMKYGIIWHF